MSWLMCGLRANRKRREDKMTPEAKQAVFNRLEKLGLEYYFSLKFDHSIASLTPEKFIKEIFDPKEIHSSQFNTYKFKYNTFDIDFAMCRKEKYNNPASLPEIYEGSLLEDQQRRDFSINSIAIKTDDFTQKKFIDPFNGILDIKAKQIKNLHYNAF